MFVELLESAQFAAVLKGHLIVNENLSKSCHSDGTSRLVLPLVLHY